MKIIFEDSDRTELGHIKHENLVETLIPAFEPDTHDMFLKHVFSSKKHVTNWQITNLLIDANIATIQLKEAASTQSLADFIAPQYRKPEDFLKPYYIVEVDFGFYSNLFNIHGAKVVNKRSTNSLLQGEMHKRRPCIVLGLKHGCVQVIPLSTKTEVGSNPKRLELSKTSFAKLAPRYTEKTSYALLEMIQTVSVHRVFPPKGINKKYEHSYHSISTTDKDLIKKALVEQYNQTLTIDYTILKTQHENLQHEKSKILESKNLLLREKKDLEENCNILKKSILKFGQEMGAGESLDEILSFIDQLGPN